MRRIPSLILLSVLFLASLCHSQSLADAARKNRAQKEANPAKAAKVIETDDISTTPDATYAPVAGQTPGQWTRQIQAQKMWVHHFQAEVDKSSAKMERARGSGSQPATAGTDDLNVSLARATQELTREKAKLEAMQKAAREAGMPEAVIDPPLPHHTITSNTGAIRHLHSLSQH